ncbi:MAG TPA: hypothetical protein VGK84_08215 [Candidatus Tumulicola sp.]
MKQTALLALAICSGCAGGQAIAPSTAQFNGIVSEPAAGVKSKYFDYIINDYGSYASIFDYPLGDNQIGTVKDVGGQGCTNVLYGYGKKILWIVASSHQIAEYEAPSKLLKTLSVIRGNKPSSCAMNANGDLAVGLLRGPRAGDVVIFKNAAGTGTYIKTPLVEEIFDGYDDKGNLFFDGLTSAQRFQLDEIPKGSATPQTIVTSNLPEFPGSVQWDGTYLAVTDLGANKMYRYAIDGTRATLKDTVTLGHAIECTQTWIATGIVFCADAGNNGGEVYDYPAGGAPIAVLKGKFDEPLGTVAVEK